MTATGVTATGVTRDATGVTSDLQGHRSTTFNKSLLGQCHTSEMENNTSLCAFNSSQRKELSAIFGAGGMAAVAVGSVALALLVFFKLYKTFSERLVLYLLLSALFFSMVLSAMSFTGAVVDLREHLQTLCKALGFLFQYSMWLLLLFTIFIVFHLAALIFFYKPLHKWEAIFVLFSLIFPLLFLWIPFIHDLYGFSGVDCLIRIRNSSAAADECSFDEEGLIETFVLWYGPFYFFLIVNAFLTAAMIAVLCYRAFRKQPNNDSLQQLTNNIESEGQTCVRFQHPDSPNTEAFQYKKALKSTLPLLAYPIIYTFFDCFALVDRIYQVTSPGKVLSLRIVHALFGPSRGFLVGVIFIVYIIAKKKLTKASVKDAYHSWKHSFVKLRQRSLSYRNSYSRRHMHAYDVFTADGYTETSPTLYEPPQESEGYESLSVSYAIN